MVRAAAADSKAVSDAGEAGASPEYRIGAGDELEVSVWKNEQLTRTVTVRPDGKISLPLVNDVRAAGLSPMQLRAAIVQALAEYVPSPDVSVIVKKVQSFAVSVIGEVKKAGHFNLTGPTTVLDAIALAGGFTEFASKGSMFLLRLEGSGVKRIPFDYNKAISAAGGEEGFFLHAGDTLVVP